MTIIEKNEGAKIAYRIRGNTIAFGDTELTLNLVLYERDEDNAIDICRDKFGNLLMGVIPNLAMTYCAQIFIPARQYEYVDGQPEETPDHGTDTEPDAENAGDMIEALQIRQPLPFNMKRCTLTLWANNCGGMNDE